MKKDKKILIFPKDCTSLLSKHLNDELYNRLKDKKTKHNFNLDQAINSGMINSDSGIGVYAGDEESYEVLDLLFDPIIQEYHGFSKNDIHKSDLNPDNLDAPSIDDNNEFIVSTRIRVGRNLKCFPLGPAISQRERLIVECMVSSALNSLEGDLGGNYYPLLGMSNEVQAILVKDHFLFKEGDRFLEAAGLNRDWPEGRGIYHNNEKTFLVWVNEEDQLRIISMQKGGDIKEVFTRLTKAISLLENQLTFAFNKHLGYITSCPTNLGTALRASVHIKLPLLSKNMEEFKSITDKYYLQIRGIHGEHSESEGGIYDISNKRRLGITEVQAVQDMYDGVKALIKRENALT